MLRDRDWEGIFRAAADALSDSALDPEHRSRTQNLRVARMIDRRRFPGVFAAISALLMSLAAVTAGAAPGAAVAQFQRVQDW